jgi:hypothetical protein
MKIPTQVNGKQENEDTNAARDQRDVQLPDRYGIPDRYATWSADASASPAHDRVPLAGCEEAKGDLASCQVDAFGLGAVGGPFFEIMARAGVPYLVGIDPDLYSSDSFLTQPCRPEDADRPKAIVQGELAHAANPGSNVITLQTFGQDAPLGLFRDADAIALAGDNRELPVSVSVPAAGMGKRIYQAAVYPAQWLAFVRCYDLTDPAAVCPACSLNLSEWSSLSTRFGCDPGQQQAQGRVPTRALPTICRTAADMLASEVLKFLLRVDGDLVANEEVVYSLKSHRICRTELPRNPRCRCPHEAWIVVDVPGSSSEVTPAMLVKEMEAEPSGLKTPLQFRSELPWISFAPCSSCRRITPIRRFGRPGSLVGQCACGAVLAASPMGLRSIMPKEDLHACLEKPLSELGVTPGRSVAIRNGANWFYFFTNDTPPWKQGSCSSRARA